MNHFGIVLALVVLPACGETRAGPACPTVAGTWLVEGLFSATGGCGGASIVDFEQTDCSLSIGGGTVTCTFTDARCTGQGEGADHVLEFTTDDSGTWTATRQAEPRTSCTATMTKRP